MRRSAHDAKQLNPGSNNPVSRPFLIPPGVPAGTYELNAELWPANKIGDDGVETLAEAPCAAV
jgi:hypothetical protein